MLVLTRKKNEDIIITLENGRTITIRLLEAKYDKAKLGFTAPEGIKILRRELLDNRIREVDR